MRSQHVDRVEREVPLRTLDADDIVRRGSQLLGSSWAAHRTIALRTIPGEHRLGRRLSSTGWPPRDFDQVHRHAGIAHSG